MVSQLYGISQLVLWFRTPPLFLQGSIFSTLQTLNKMTTDIVKDIARTVKDLVGNEPLYFDEALIIKTSPHTLPFIFWAVSVSSDNRVYIMDGGEEWHQVEEKDEVIVSSLYQRVSSIAAKYKTAI